MEEKLPFENREEVINVKKKADTSSDYGCEPTKRSVQELINYGIVNINKPAGPTSHQISAYVKEILNISKAGHSGTLDPNVTGCLPVALAKGTRVVQALLNAGKEYVCLMRLHQDVDDKKIIEAFKKFTGSIKQLPPVRSAVKRQLRRRNIYYMNILEILYHKEIKKKEVLFKVGCEAGTYIRKLCLHPNTDLISENGVVTAKNFFNVPRTVYSLNKGRAVKTKPSQLQKLISPKKLICIKTSSGIEIIVTPDHKMLTSEKSGYKMVEAGKLKEGSYLVKSLNIPYKSKDHIIADLLDDEYLVDQPKIKEMCKNAFLKKYGSIRKMYRELKLDRKAFLKKSKNAITLKHIKLSGIYNKIKSKINKFKTQKGQIIKLNRLNSDHFYLMGLIASDGNNTREKNTTRHTRLKFHNVEEILIDKFKEIYKKLFPSIPISKTLNKKLFQLETSNSLFATICASMGIISPYTKNSDLLPILNSKPEFIIPFLKGYFDGDGTAYFKKKEKIKGHYSNIRIYCISYLNIKRIHQMLIRLGISNRILRSRTGFKPIYFVEVNDIASKKLFISKIGTNHPRKMAYFKNIMKLTDTGDSGYIGLHFNKSMAKNKRGLRKMGGNLNRVLSGSLPVTRGFYRKCAEIVDLPKLDDCIIEKVVSIKRVKGCDFVYDMTIPKVHNFLIETGFVSSNCHDIGQELKVGGHMQQLVRTKAGPFKDKNWVSLQDLKDAYVFWKEENNEKEIRKCIQPYENAVDHLPKIWVLDSAVDSLCHGASLSVPGVSKFNEFSQDQLVAIMTLKGELIGLGQAKMGSLKLLNEENGIVATKTKIFMERGIYPKK